MSLAEERPQQADRFQIRPLTPHIGAELLDLDLRDFDAAMIDDIRAAEISGDIFPRPATRPVAAY